ncbi:glycosyltransferase [Psychroserpens sp. SPM9]|uniref:glycosyltransferase n=1 Tax=Psychroserpens sp. SPM9 TaxID=2975598 RepID=UPI0021A805E3|nr:glycosyltransferase [Psychroserpens sp. SPM9]MDG5491656.1 glycosyltransferase [Psychroserpens sp. SPM9]
MDKTIKIVFILPSLKAGGAERVVSFIAQHLDKTKFKPILLIVGFEKDAVFSVDGVETHFLNKTRVLDGVKGIFSKLKALQPQIVMTSIAHLTAVTVIQSVYFRKIKFVAREANIKKVTRQYHDNATPFGNVLYTWSYKLLDLIICQSKDMADELIELRPKTKNKIQIINNPITKTYAERISVKQQEKPQYITVGRLHDEKGHCRILEALSLLDHDFNYTIIGEGPHKAAIVNKAKALNLSDKIIWIDYTSEVQKHLAHSSVFIQGSYAEGFPNALLESCAVGTPVVAYDCLGGTSEIVKQGVNGYLVASEEELKVKLIELLTHPIDQQQIINSVMKKFSKKYIINQYEQTFINLINN